MFNQYCCSYGLYRSMISVHLNLKVLGNWCFYFIFQPKYKVDGWFDVRSDSLSPLAFILTWFVNGTKASLALTSLEWQVYSRITVHTLIGFFSALVLLVELFYLLKELPNVTDVSVNQTVEHGACNTKVTGQVLRGGTKTLD